MLLLAPIYSLKELNLREARQYAKFPQLLSGSWAQTPAVSFHSAIWPPLLFFSTSHYKIIERLKEKGSIFYGHNIHSGPRKKEQNERLSAQENSSLKQSAKTEIQQTGIAVN